MGGIILEIQVQNTLVLFTSEENIVSVGITRRHLGLVGNKRERRPCIRGYIEGIGKSESSKQLHSMAQVTRCACGDKYVKSNERG